MASHKGWDREFYTSEGLAMKTGRSLNIARGQFAVVDMGSIQNQRGLEVISSFGALPKNRKLEMRMGVSPKHVNRSQSDKAMATQPFMISEVKGLRVDSPKVKGVEVDHFRIGFDGLNPDTIFKLQNGDNEMIEIILTGQAIGMLGYTNAQATLQLYLEAPNTGEFTDQEIFERAVKTFNEMTLMGGVPVTNYVKASIVNSNAVANTGTNYSFFKLNLKDNGDETSRGRVQAQVPGFDVKTEGNFGGTSTYVILAPTGTSIPDYTEKVTSTIPDCDECPTGYSLVAGLCTKNTTTTYAWEAKETCVAKQETYSITLADPKCGTNRLADLQANYPDLVIAVSTLPSNDSERKVTLTGTSGTANVAVGGTNYLATFTTNLATTASNFVTTHAAALLVEGVEVTATTGVLNFKALTQGFPTITITGATTNLSGTVAAVAVIPSDPSGACLTNYTTSVMTNVVCADCSPEITGLFESEAPKDFEQKSWRKTNKVYDEAALMSIDFKSTVQTFFADEQFRDTIPTMFSSVRLNVTGGLPFVNESFKKGRQNRIPVTMLSRAQESENYGFNFQDWENRSNQHFLGRQRFENNAYGNWVLGQESNLKQGAQYVDYAVDVRTTRFAQSFGGEVVENFTYHIFAEVGKHKDIEDILNALATAAGIPTVAAYS